MRISDWSSDVCSSDLAGLRVEHRAGNSGLHALRTANQQLDAKNFFKLLDLARQRRLRNIHDACCRAKAPLPHNRSEEHTSELQSLMRISYAVFCLKKKRQITTPKSNNKTTMHKYEH